MGAIPEKECIIMMKKMKRLIALLMTMAMVMGMGVTAFAAGNGTISVSNADGATIKYAQIIEEDRTSPLGWKFVDDMETPFVNAWKIKDSQNNSAEKVIGALINLGKLENPANYNASNGTINSDAAYSAALEAVVNNATKPLDNNKKAKGLYVVKAEKTGWTYMPMAAYMNSAGDDVVIAAKGSKDQIKKEVGDLDHAVSSGDILSYTVQANYPYYPANAENKTFKITDTIENATFQRNSVKVKIGNDTETVVPTFSNGNRTMTVDFNYNPQNAGKTVTVEYKVVVDSINGDAEIRVKNNAKGEANGKYTVAEVISDSATFTILKYDEKTNELLSGAEFTLYVKDDNGNKEIKYEGNTIKVSVVETKATVAEDNESTVFEEENGTVTFFGLDPDKEYYVEETKAPDGYVKLETIWKLNGADKSSNTIDSTEKDENNVSYTKKTTTITVTDYDALEVPNTKLSSLPSTGGIGTTIFTIAGCAIMIAAAGLFFATRKKA